MFCQNCGAELRLEAGFCAVCGASIPRPVLRQELADRGNKPQRLTEQPQRQNAQNVSQQPSPGSSLLGDAPMSYTSSQADPRPVHSFQAIRQASGQRGSMRALPPVASLAVPAESATLPEQMVPPPAQPEALPTPVAPVAIPEQPYQSNGHAPSMPTLAGMPTVQGNGQLSLNGFHPVGVAAPGVNGHAQSGAANGSAPQDGSTAALFNGYAPMVRAANVPTSGIHLPNDIPNRLALSGLVGMFLSFFLPWVIINGSRATPLSVGWPVFLPLALIACVALTILTPERTLYARFVLALPFAFGCFALGSAFVVFLVSSAIAANTVGAAFLGVDIGFVFFAIASCVLASAGYFKLLRELPLLYTGQMTLAPLPGMLGRASASATQRATPRSSGAISNQHGPTA
ncbi:MAG TPA: zinc-ribbon domain-containing protein [Ktedonobacterales bacterium]|nr:zinc-ribbon domain-containing protein [Ktedonobacterales bacterium]